MTSTTLSPDIHVMEAIERAIPCESSDHPRMAADLPAAWVLHVTKCCVQSQPYVLACDDCMKYKLDPTVVIICEDCDEVFDPPSTAYWMIEALNGRTR